MQIDSLVCARWIIPVVPDGVIFEHHAIAINGGRIIDILPQTQALANYQAVVIERLPQHALIPGFINAHTHAAMSLLRGIADDRPLMEWLSDFIWPLEQQWVSESFVRDGTDLAMAEMLRSGVTCFNDMYFFSDITAQQAGKCGMRASIGLILVDFPSAWASSADEYLTKGLALHDELRNEPLLSTVFAPHAPYTVSIDALKRMRVLAAELDRPVHTHLHETQGEIVQCLQRYGMRPLQLLQQLEITGPSLIAVHMTQLNDDEIEAFAASGAHVVHCPESNLKLASGFCPLARLLAAGVNVALGTDGAASNNDLNILSEMRTAALLAKGVSQRADAVPATAALRMATLNGARALGLESEIGSLEIGKSADMTAIRLDAIETQPLYNPVSQIVYAADREQISDVWVAGRPLLKGRQLTTLDLADIQQRTEQWRTKLAPRQNP
jgi:5-methylthioadenosine/S-adenosylhomocysteine deaminase